MNSPYDYLFEDLSMLPGPWSQQARCSAPDVDPAIFYLDPAEDHQPAREICDQCPVQRACLEHALSVGEIHGIWAGTDPAQRRQLQASTGHGRFPRRNASPQRRRRSA